ncbi:Piso0_000316 [Millerozyma farinosa CBS 7064]|uniref:Piso0_000316 protein n=1 Tax=Pichia sorbitophila (strain ATCC MYA-4447 / BCRC 22081 / CBS 7064 / NBRC 10061 / NRRL Y-12695) TaxID=559304 RepID=G8YTN4_PICSO|nr:Piso0_000316 [Millerozyma farinosa CBS 7064]
MLFIVYFSFLSRSINLKAKHENNEIPYTTFDLGSSKYSTFYKISSTEMQIADGEYDIDISCLQDSVAASDTEEYFAIRYGFVPDSMDKGQSVNLYESENEYILEAKSTDNNSQKSVLFEGNIQRYQPKNRGPGDNYILTMSLDGKRMALKKLDSMIRMNKTRNAHKLQSQIDMIGKGNSLSASYKSQSKSKLAQHASKRLPGKNSYDKNENSNSLNSGKSIKPKVNPKSLERDEKPSKRATTGARQLENDDEDFRDLENELEEVLEEENQQDSAPSDLPASNNGLPSKSQPQIKPPYNDNDDSEDESIQYMANPFTANLPIEHEDPEEINNSYSRFHVSNNNGKKPMSLKDLVGSNADDGSSSEEE